MAESAQNAAEGSYSAAAGTSAISVSLDAVPSRITPASEKPDDILDTAVGNASEVKSTPMVGFSVKYQGSVLSVRLAEDETVADLKAILFSMTDVPPESQKLLGMVKGKQPSDDIQLGTIPYAPAALRARPATKSQVTTVDTAVAADQACKITVQFTLLGTPEAGRFKDQAASSLADQVDAVQDLDYLELPKAEEPKLKPHKDPQNLAKLEKIIRRFSDFPIINPPRPGKKLLVLDLDYCIADTKRLLDPNSPASLAARPGLHELLKAVYPHYDICVWSQTSWRWLEVKLVELNMLGNPDYNISFVIDRTPMFKIHSRAGTHEVKALEFIWRRWPEVYGRHNTIHIDDLSRNFAMNPRNGLKIKAYKNSPNFDTEFVALRRYLLQLAHPSVSDFTKYEHMQNAWKHFQGPEV
ncbi:uncharacterized protein MEPE_04944 [Melanopsichium pennsylvanicum]|uniref:protein-serine/threonine phosphatase n=2 Tax=Melanopsichium pennsylvanicum TaxID=63383 RepID=A0AAJ5C6U7_9BASI|nr:had subfamily iiid h [Melanopsichium pennsylvanicum 4]SNX86235.1 uncharacterized protein MEPE_04944 [Melanopsichium pennsylvanicum]